MSDREVKKKQLLAKRRANRRKPLEQVKEKLLADRKAKREAKPQEVVIVQKGSKAKLDGMVIEPSIRTLPWSELCGWDKRYQLALPRLCFAMPGCRTNAFVAVALKPPTSTGRIRTQDLRFLPLPHIYDDGQICMRSNGKRFDSITELIDDFFKSRFDESHVEGYLTVENVSMKSYKRWQKRTEEEGLDWINRIQFPQLASGTLEDYFEFDYADHGSPWSNYTYDHHDDPYWDDDF